MRNVLIAGAALIALASAAPAAAQSAGNQALPPNATGADPTLGVQRGQGSTQTGSSELGQRGQAATTDMGAGPSVERTQNPGNPVATSNSAERDPVTGVQRGQGSTQTGSSELGDRPPQGDRTTGIEGVIGTAPPVGGSGDPTAVPR